MYIIGIDKLNSLEIILNLWKALKHNKDFLI